MEENQDIKLGFSKCFHQLGTELPLSELINWFDKEISIYDIEEAILHFEIGSCVDGLDKLQDHIKINIMYPAEHIKEKNPELFSIMKSITETIKDLQKRPICPNDSTKICISADCNKCQFIRIKRID